MYHDGIRATLLFFLLSLAFYILMELQQLLQ